MENQVKSVNDISWERRFNVGLTLDTNLKEFTNFLDRYGKNIYSFFFSTPIQCNLHSRDKISRQFSSEKKEKLFWEMLKIIKQYGIRLEVLFNMPNIGEDDVVACKKTLDEHKVVVDSVCFMEDCHDAVVKHFPNAEYVWSYNNGHFSEQAFEKVVTEKKYDTYVLGGANIRNNEFFGKVKGADKKIILLINNGCTFYCPRCSNKDGHCKKIFKKNLEKHSVEYLYALQSVFPNELIDGTIDSSLIDYFKISNRSSDIKYTKAVMDSYMSNKVKKYIRFNKSRYSYWGRLGNFWKYFYFFRLGKIKKYKEEILGHPINVE